MALHSELRRQLVAALCSSALLLGTLVQADVMIDGDEVKPEDQTAVFGMQVNRPADDGFDSSYEGVCTAFLVAPRLLLTAAHCLQYIGAIDLLANGPDLNQWKTRGTALSPVKYAAYPTFEAPSPDMSESDRAKNAAIDIGYITLKDPATVTPLAVYLSRDSSSMTALAGLEATVVGYGATHFLGIDGDYSFAKMLVKHQGQLTITSAQPGYIFLAGDKNGVLPGDSGGPEIAVINGVTKVVALNHGMNGKQTGNSTDPYQYGFSIGTLLTEANLCWVVKDSGQPIPDVACPAGP